MKRICPVPTRPTAVRASARLSSVRSAWRSPRGGYVHGKQGTAVDTATQTLRSEIAQVTTDRIFRNTELLSEIRRDDFAIALQALEDQLLPLARQRRIRHVHLGRNPSLISSARSWAGV